MDPTTAPQEFDLFTQEFNLTFPDGSMHGISMQLIEDSRVFIARLATNYGAQTGATTMLLLVLLLLTRADKRKSNIFLINAICLVANTTRCILFTCYTTSSILNPYAQLTGDWSRVTSGDLATTAAMNVFTLIVTILVMISLSMQVWVVCVTTAPVHRYIIMCATTIVALLAIGYKTAFVALNIKDLLNFEATDAYVHIYQESYIAQAVAICFFSCVFTYKLGHAIYQRRKLNMPQFGPMQIVFVMGCQTMMIPAIFTLLQFRSDTTELGVVVLTIVCIFLPLSAIWAGVVNETALAPGGKNSHHVLIQNEFYRSAPNSTIGSNSSTTMYDKSRQMSVCTCATKCDTPIRNKSIADEDDGIHIGREFGFRTDAADRV